MHTVWNITDNTPPTGFQPPRNQGGRPTHNATARYESLLPLGALHGVPLNTQSRWLANLVTRGHHGYAGHSGSTSSVLHINPPWAASLMRSRILPQGGTATLSSGQRGQSLRRRGLYERVVGKAGASELRALPKRSKSNWRLHYISAASSNDVRLCCNVRDSISAIRLSSP